MYHNANAIVAAILGPAVVIGNLLLLGLFTSGETIDPGDVYMLVQAQMVIAAVLVLMVAGAFVYSQIRSERADERRHKDMREWLIAANHSTLRSNDVRDMMERHDEQSKIFVQEIRELISKSSAGHTDIAARLLTIEALLVKHEDRLSEVHAELQGALERAKSGKTAES